MPINQHMPLGGVVKARQEVEDGRLAAADWPQQRDCLAGLCVDVDLLDHLEVLAVTEGDVFVLDMALDV